VALLKRYTQQYAALWILLLAVVSHSFTLPPPTVVAQRAEGIAYSYSFGQIATFSLTFSQGLPSAEAQLYIRISDAGQEYTKMYPVPTQDGQASFDRDLRENPFPPFSRISFWWEYPSDQGKTYETETTTFLYEDNRFRWQIIQEENITIHWVTGEDALMLSAMDIARASVHEIQNAFQAPTIDPVSIYIYPSLADLQSALRLAGQSWVGGEAHPDVSVVLLAISPSREAVLEMERDIPHELAHVLLHRITGPEGYKNLPTWMTEGLATYFERRPEAAYALALQKARTEGSLIPLEHLCGIFPAEHEQAVLAYAESQSVVTYLQRTHGWSRIRALLEAYSDGLGCSEGLKRALGIDLPTLERDWRVWLEQEGRPMDSTQRIWTIAVVLLRDIAPWLIVSSVLLLPGFLSLVASRPKG